LKPQTIKLPVCLFSKTGTPKMLPAKPDADVTIWHATNLNMTQTLKDSTQVKALARTTPGLSLCRLGGEQMQPLDRSVYTCTCISGKASAPNKQACLVIIERQ
jgi:hypothetical protein